MPIVEVYVSKDLKERVNRLSLEQRRALGDKLRSLIRRRLEQTAPETAETGSKGRSQR